MYHLLALNIDSHQNQILFKSLIWASLRCWSNGILYYILTSLQWPPWRQGGCCREVLKKSQCMDFWFAGTKKSGHCREVAISGGSTVQYCKLRLSWFLYHYSLLFFRSSLSLRYRRSVPREGKPTTKVCTSHLKLVKRENIIRLQDKQ